MILSDPAKGNLPSVTYSGIDPESVQPFVIGYFKEEVGVEEDEDKNGAYKTASSNLYINARDLFSKAFVMMKHPSPRPRGTD